MTSIVEFTINDRPLDVVEKILSRSPRIAAFGVYIWNTAQTCQVIKLLKRIAPQVTVIVGGPEVSHETDGQEIVALSDYCITGEADLTFPKLCAALLEGQTPETKVIRSPLPKMEEIKTPYEFYTADDIANRVIYVEASRGCPFTCEFCLSSLDVPVRQVDLPSFLSSVELLFQAGARQFKFVDRTFNLNLRTSQAILNFFLERYEPGLFVHFEMIPDRLPAGLRGIIQKFPSGALQFEVGIQSFNPEVNVLISRRQDFAKIEENLRFLREETGVHIHADLIAGLPGETLKSFGEGFDRLLRLNPQEIQVGILKRLKGTPIIRHDREWQMKYSPFPPYEILSNSLIDFPTMQRIGRFSRYWDLFSNSGTFIKTLPFLWRNKESPFAEFMKFSDQLYKEIGQRHGISLENRKNYLSRYLQDRAGIESRIIEESLRADFLPQSGDKVKLPPRQVKHTAANLG